MTLTIDVGIQTDFISKTQADLVTCQQRPASLTGQLIQPTDSGSAKAPPLVDLSNLQPEPPVQKVDVTTQPHWLPNKPVSPLEEIYRETKSR